MEENEYDKALGEMLKERRINLNRKDSRLLMNENENYHRHTASPYNFERPEENNLQYITFIVKDDVTKEDLDIVDTDMHLSPLYKNVEKDVNVDISNYAKIFTKEVKDLNTINKDQLYFVETNDGFKTSIVMLSKNDNILTIRALRTEEADIQICIDAIKIINFFTLKTPRLKSGDEKVHQYSFVFPLKSSKLPPIEGGHSLIPKKE